MKENIRKASVIAQLADMNSDLKKRDENYGVEVVGDTAYTNYLGDTSVYHARYRDNDFVGTAKECLDYIKSKGITEIYGVLKDE